MAGPYTRLRVGRGPAWRVSRVQAPFLRDARSFGRAYVVGHSCRSEREDAMAKKKDKKKDKKKGKKKGKKGKKK
jgi:hypothetical protein